MIAVLLTGCYNTPDTADPLFVVESPIGAFPKLVELETDFFDLTDLENSAYAHTVDFVDGQGGLGVNVYNVYYSYKAEGEEETDWRLFRSIGAREFIVRPETNQIGFDLMIRFSEIADSLGINDFSTFSTEDEFNFRTELEKSDGRIFSSANSTPVITNAFGGIWDFRVLIE